MDQTEDELDWVSVFIAMRAHRAIPVPTVLSIAGEVKSSFHTARVSSEPVLGRVLINRDW